MDLRLWCPRLGSFGVVVLEIVCGLKAVDFRQPEVLLVNKVDEFMVRKRSLKALADHLDPNKLTIDGGQYIDGHIGLKTLHYTIAKCVVPYTSHV